MTARQRPNPQVPTRQGETEGIDHTVTQPGNATSAGLTMTSAGGDTYTAVMNDGRRYTVRQEDWSVKTDYYLDTFVYHLPDLVSYVGSTGNPMHHILEMGVARGVLSIGMALLTDDETRILGIDIEESARMLVAENAIANGVADKVEVRVGDLFEPVHDGERFDLIFGELPFIPVDPDLQRQYIADGHASEILNVSGGPDGRQLVDLLIEQGAPLLDQGGAMLLIQPSFIGVETTMALLAAHGLAGKILVRREWRLDDTKFTRQIRGYIEGLNSAAFVRNDDGDEVFYLTIIVGVKE